MAKTALFLGRFQPFHNAHLFDVKNILKECDEIIIALGSSDKKNTEENPFSAEERTMMIERCLQKEGISSYSIFPVPDIGDDERYVEHVRKIVPKYDIVYTGSEWTEKLFKAKKDKVVKIKLIPGINATIIRDRMLHNENWKALVHEEVAKAIAKINGVERVKNIKG